MSRLYHSEVAPSKYNLTGSERNLDRDWEDRILNLTAVKGFLTRKMLEAESGWKQTKAGMILKEFEVKGMPGKTGPGEEPCFI
jgi:hypothetical protein